IRNKEIIGSNEWLIRNGFLRSADHIALPGGRTTNELEEVVSRTFKTARTTAGNGVWELNTLPVSNNYRLRTIGVTKPKTLAEIKAKVDLAIKSNSWAIFMFHDIKDEPSNDGWDTPSFKALMDYIAEKGVKVKTMSEM